MRDDVKVQFGIARLMKLTTVCCVLAAFTWLIGVGPALFLAIFVTLLEMRFGLSAIFALAAALLASKTPAEFGPDAFWRHLSILVLALILPLASRFLEMWGRATAASSGR